MNKATLFAVIRDATEDGLLTAADLRELAQLAVSLRQCPLKDGGLRCQRDRGHDGPCITWNLFSGQIGVLSLPPSGASVRPTFPRWTGVSGDVDS